MSVWTFVLIVWAVLMLGLGACVVKVTGDCIKLIGPRPQNDQGSR